MTFTSGLSWKRNEVQSPPTPRRVLSSLFNDAMEKYVTSDHYGSDVDDRDEISMLRGDAESDSDRDPPTSESSQSLSPKRNSSSSSKSPPSMDFVTFDGVWDDCADTSRSDDDLPWQFIEFGFDEIGKNSKSTNSSKKSKKKSNLSKSTAKLMRVYDTDRSTQFPLQNITNKRNIRQTSKVKQQEANYRVQQPRLQQSVIKKTFKTKALRKEEPSAKQSWSKCALSSSSVSTSPTLSISPLSEDDKFWDDIFSQSSPSGERIKVAYSKRSTVNDGSMIQSEDIKQLRNRVLTPNDVHLKTSYWTEMNKRSYMEDRVMMDFLGNVPLPSTNGLDMAVLFRKLKAIKSNSLDESLRESTDANSTSSPTFPLSLFATFDGHAGHLASQYCSDWFSYYLQRQPSYPYDLPLALRTAFHNIDVDFMKSGNEDGTTSCVCAVIGNHKVICANAGDSRAIIVRRDGGVISLSRDHKPGSPRENKRIKDLGGSVVYSGRWRVEGRLAVSRGIGDSSLKRFITPDPDVYEYNILPDDWFLVIGTDGIWDVLQNHQVASMALSYSCTASKEDQTLTLCNDYLKWTAKKISDHAKSLGSRDNLGVLVVDLQSLHKKENL